MKRVVITLAVLIMAVFLVGCLDYKAYDIPEEDTSAEDASLVDEIAEIERELAAEEELVEEPVEEVVGEEVMEDFPEEEGVEVVEEDVVLPELEETVTMDGEVQVIKVKENELVKLNVEVTDPDKDPVTYAFSKPLNKQGEWKTGYGDAGEYMVTLSATDGKLTTEKKLQIVVERVNVAPMIEALEDVVVKEGAVVELEPKVTDPNEDPVTVTITEPLKSGAFATDHTSSGEYMVTVTASDGELETKETFRLMVQDVNVLPEITGVRDVQVEEGGVVELKPVVSDLDNDEITLTISDPVGNDGVWETAFTDHGEYVVTIAADDGKDRVTKKVKVTVGDINMPPVIVDVSLDN